ncbi:MAG TPA: hypothetical protein VHQ65_16665 [Thermoanaerobaculia bacterium]|nr:hypothetical protein [Thermoanaerobaculia bacterium]
MLHVPEDPIRRPTPRSRLGAFRWPALALAAAILLPAAGAGAERACSQDPVFTGRTCPEEVCLTLQGRVNKHCKEEARSCNGLTDCAELASARQNRIQCATNRDIINSRCWNGGDPGHREAATNAWRGVNNCNVRMIEHCPDCPWDAPEVPDEPPVEGAAIAAESEELGLLPVPPLSCAALPAAAPAAGAAS